MTFENDNIVLFGSLAASVPLLVAIISKVYKNVRTDSASLVGIQSDAQRIKDMQESLRLKDQKIDEKDALISKLVEDKVDLSGKVGKLETELAHAMEQIAYLTNLVEYLVKQNGGKIPLDLVIQGAKFHDMLDREGD
jgi:peptidoglycan hydrolase CwlO-like protein